ncbi:MAG TPA: hypothetical protein VJC37_06260 [Planctomycetota bacterium]|nr:hypothetical protein [Planctomycetota bacterium]
MPSLTEARKFQELLNLPANDSPYLFDKIFDNSGFWARRLSKKKFKLLKNIDPAIRAMLQPGESVCFLTWGVGEATVDSFLLGNLTAYINHRAFVLTTSRILLIQLTPGRKTAMLRGQVEYAGISKVGSSLLGNLTITFHNAEKTIFSQVPKADRKFLGQLIDGLRQQIAQSGRKNLSAQSDLCPHCYKIVDTRPESCPHCAGPFKSARRAILLSFILPGLGYWYLGYKFISLIPMIISAIIWFAIIVILLDSASPSEALELIFPLVFFYAFSVIATYSIAKKGIYPVAKKDP